MSRLDIYIADSLKGSARTKRGQGVHIHVVTVAVIPGNWQNFLRMDSNKTELFRFLSEALLKWIDQEDKQLVITDGEVVLSKSPLPDLASLAPCSHEEAGSRMLLYASRAAQHAHHKIMIRTIDTDVVVLAVSVAQGLQPEDELWLAFGTGKSFQYLVPHEMAAGLGSGKPRAMPMFHALNGCDTVFSFAGHGKKTAWAIWTVLPELINSLLKLSAAPSDLPENVLYTTERYVILLYDRNSTCTDIDKTRKKLFAKKNNLHLIPPTKATLEDMSRGRSTREAVCRATHCYWHRSCLHQPAGAGPRMRRGCTSRTGQDYPKQPTSAMSKKG